jgi:HK97 family phage major capsid protein
MTITTERPASSAELAYNDLNKFISYLKGTNNEHCKASIPNEIANSIASKIKALSPIKSLAKTTYTSRDKLDIVVDSDDSERSGWITDELIKCDEITSISKISIHLHQLFAKPKVAHSLLDDDTAKVEEFIKDKIVTQMASAENKSFLFGDGISQPKGILKCDISTDGPKRGQIEAIVGGKTGAIESYNKIVELMELLGSKYLAGASWFMSRNAASHVRTMRDEKTGKYLWQFSIAYGIPDTLLGYPVVICDDMPKITSDDAQFVPILFANLYEGYQIVERPTISILKDPYNSKPFVEFYATKRIGGDVVNHDAIKALVLRSE